MKHVVALLALAAACSSKDHFSSEAMQRPDEPPKTRPSKPTMSTAELARGCALYAKSTCQTLQRCSPRSTSLEYGDGCEAALERECKLVHGVPGSGASEAWLTACAGWSLSASCAEYDRDGGDCATPPGQLADGATCSSTVQCKSRRCSKSQYGANCGTCAPAKPEPPTSKTLPKLGEKCTDDCDDALYCDHGTCTAPPPRAAGESCTEYVGGSRREPCGPGLSCAGGKCVKRPLDGEACTTGGAHCSFPAMCRDGKCAPPDFTACK